MILQIFYAAVCVFYIIFVLTLSEKYVGIQAKLK